MNDFIAIDVETANNHPSSICALGAVKVEGGVIVDEFYELVKPEPEYYFRHFCVAGYAQAIRLRIPSGRGGVCGSQ